MNNNKGVFIVLGFLMVIGFIIVLNANKTPTIVSANSPEEAVQMQPSVTAATTTESDLKNQQNLRQLQDNCHDWGNTIASNSYYGTAPIISTHYKSSTQKCYVEIDYWADTIENDVIFDASTQQEILDKEYFLYPANDQSTYYKDLAKDFNDMYINEEQFSNLKNQYMTN